MLLLLSYGLENQDVLQASDARIADVGDRVEASKRRLVVLHQTAQPLVGHLHTVEVEATEPPKNGEEGLVRDEWLKHTVHEECSTYLHIAQFYIISSVLGSST